MKPHILVVEDDPDLAFGLEDDLKVEGYEVTVVRDGAEALRRGLEGAWDLILLDVMLPNRDGFELCRAWRGNHVNVPIVMLTAKAQEAEKVLGLELGADDYITKPFSPRELRARIKAALRRSSVRTAAVCRVGDIEVDLARGEVRRSGIAVELTPLEFKIMAALVRNRGRVLNRDQLLEAAWGPGVFLTDRVVDHHVVNLRRKLERDPEDPRHLVCVRGLGYRLDD